jgi:glutaredoxin-related protein
LAQNEDKDQIFNAYCEFLNYFDASIKVQLSFVNKYGNIKDFEKSIHIPDQDDAFNSVRREYADMMKNQLAKGNNGLVKHNDITVGIDAKNLAEAKPRLERIEADI